MQKSPQLSMNADLKPSNQDNFTGHVFSPMTLGSHEMLRRSTVKTENQAQISSPVIPASPAKTIVAKVSKFEGSSLKKKLRKILSKDLQHNSKRSQSKPSNQKSNTIHNYSPLSTQFNFMPDQQQRIKFQSASPLTERSLSTESALAQYGGFYFMGPQDVPKAPNRATVKLTPSQQNTLLKSQTLAKAFESQTLKDKQDDIRKSCQNNRAPEAKSRISLRDAIFGEAESVQSILLDGSDQRNNNDIYKIQQVANNDLQVINEQSEIIFQSGSALARNSNFQDQSK